ncbi:DUF2088 domain-containing protein [Treponema socranskii]|uniref:lactate racemase domain-containing protein n=1 Tax=Treponema socranskii TaxID=53419 RepID=UPI003D94BD55
MTNRRRDSQWDRDGVIHEMLKDVPIPRMGIVKQYFKDHSISDIPGAIKKEFCRPEIAKTIRPGDSIAITVGSRGIANIPLITREIVRNVKKLGGKPFIIPAMGSHGGATAQGQKEYLEGLGVTEEYIEAPIISSMDTVKIAETDDGKEVRIDVNAAHADGIIVAGRIKPHTAFRGEFESGLYKMMTIGLGKQKGAEFCHSEGFKNMAHNVKTFGKIILDRAPILFGLALVEDSFDNTAIIEAIPVNQIPTREPELLLKAKALMPKIYINKIDILIVDQIGKNFSGDGMDPNITASYCTPYAHGGPDVQRYIVLDLSDETHGNAIGAGMADFSTKRMFDKMDFDAAYPNALTCTVLKGAKVPVILKNDKTAIQAAIFTCVGIDKKFPRIVRIANSAHIEKIMVSEALKAEVEAHTDMGFLSEFQDLDFDKEGNLKIGEF